MKKMKETIASSVTDEKTVKKTRKRLTKFYDGHSIAIFGPPNLSPADMCEAAPDDIVDLGWDESAWMFESDNFVMYGQIENEEAVKAKSLWYFTEDQVKWGGHASETVVEGRHEALDFFYCARDLELKGVPLKCAKRVVREG
eukprot:COSAG04_NODE_11720_length_692_cov_1.602024_2_plen_142_part_00